MAGVKDSIKKLRELRDSLCSQQDVWKDAFGARDRVIKDLQELYTICTDKKTRKKQIEKKLLDMFDYLQVTPNDTAE